MCKLNRATYAVELNEATSIIFFQVLTELENYDKVCENPNLLSTLLSLFSIIEKMLVFHWKVK